MVAKGIHENSAKRTIICNINILTCHRALRGLRKFRNKKAKHKKICGNVIWGKNMTHQAKNLWRNIGFCHCNSPGNDVSGTHIVCSVPLGLWDCVSLFRSLLLCGQKSLHMQIHFFILEGRNWSLPSLFMVALKVVDSEMQMSKRNMLGWTLNLNSSQVESTSSKQRFRRS